MDKSYELLQLDTELLNSYAQSLGYNVVKQMFTLYQQQVTIYLNDIEKSLCCDDIKLWQEHCHKMKGAAASVGLKQLHERLKVMEKTTANNSDKAKQLAALTQHNAQAMVEFNCWLAKL